MFKIAAFDFIPNTENIYNPALGLDGDDNPEALSENFELVGFETTYFVHNMGSLVFFILAFPALALTAYLFKFCRQFRAIRKAKKDIEKSIYWNYVIRLLIESYTILAVCGMINLTALEWGEPGTIFISINAIMFLIICAILPFLQLYLVQKNFEKI